ncbi:MAG: glycosyltransferase family 2 protein [Candidatus Vogelbacteria bacterium]|nr:glycosyltransferase family 2 protein [Candidatus Vogelbacteria bacterium]
MENKSTTSQKLISICIPTYEMYGKGAFFLKRSLGMLTRQTFKDFDVVISDYSKDSEIKDLCEKYKGKLDIHYFKNNNPVVGMSLNVNNAIANATGKLIKILFLDDSLFNENSLTETIRHFDLEKDHWLVTGCTHTKDGKTFFRPHLAKYHNKIHMGQNTIGSPSVLTIKNDKPPLFDTNLKWFMDCDYYKRCFDAYGAPKIVDSINVVIGVGSHQISNTEATKDLRKAEFKYIVKKYNEKTIRDITLVAISSIDPKGAVRALELSMDGMEFHETILISHKKPNKLNPRITFKQCKPDELRSSDPKNKDDYSKFMAYSLCDYIDSDFALIVHNNAHILRPYKWDYEFLDYDYIGAPWRKNTHFTPEGINVRVGNGGFSLRSKKLLNVLNVLKLPFTDNGTGFFNEDGIICVYYRKQLEDYGIKFAPVEVAAKFSMEHENEDSDIEPFGFHDNKKAIPRFFFLKRLIRKLIKK